MSKMWIILFLFVMPLSYAAIVPVTYTTSVEFDAERDFTIRMPNGFERHFVWEKNKTHSDVSFVHTLYYNFSESLWCPQSQSQIREYSNITRGMTSMLAICSSAVKHMNNSADCMKKVESVSSDKIEYERLWKICSDDRLKYKNLSEKQSGSLEMCERARDECQASVIGIKNNNEEYAECVAKLDENESSSTNTMFLAAGVGLAVGYFMWGKKTRGGPSEQAEAGPGYSDYSESYRG